MKNKKYIKWDIKRGVGVYKSITTARLKEWIKGGVFKAGEEIFIWRSGMSGWRKPEELDEFKKLFKKGR